MISLTSKKALVVGDAGPIVDRAVELLRRRQVPAAAVRPEEFGIRARRNHGEVDLVVWCGAEGSGSCGDLGEWVRQGVRIVGERELAFQQSYCLHVAVTGACGKRTTCEMIAHLLRATGRRAEVAAWPDRPASGWAEASRDLDFLIHAVEPHEIEFFEYFRPVVAVLLNAPERADAEMGEAGIRRYTALFARQQPFDWAVVEARAMARIESAGIRLPGKAITFSATSRRADLGFERGLLVSRLEGWSGPLWDMGKGKLRGGQFAEDAMAALAVGRVLRLGLEEMTTALRDFEAPPGRFEWLGDTGGVGFVHDGSACHLEALERALHAVAPIPPENPFVWLISEGRKAGGHVYDLGPVLASRVRHAFVLGEQAGLLQAAWQLFTPCTVVTSLLDAANRAVEQAAPGDVILYSPGCPHRGQHLAPAAGHDEFRDFFRTRRRQTGGTDDSPGTHAPGREIVPLANFSSRAESAERVGALPGSCLSLSPESSNRHRS